MTYLHCTFTDDELRKIDIIVEQFHDLQEASDERDQRNYAYRGTGRTFYVEEVR